MRKPFYIGPTRFGTIISPSSQSWHQSFLKTYDNKIGHNKHTYVVVLAVQNSTGSGQNYVRKYNTMLLKQ